MSEPMVMDVTPPKRSFWRNLSPIWLVPILAAIVTLGIAWQNYSKRGTLVEITFQNASGITPGDTALRLRDVNIGIVEKVRFSHDLAQVIISARIDRDIASNLPEDASFWIVRPQISASGVSGLSTVLSGAYIETAFVPKTGAGATTFVGLEKAPLVAPGDTGRRITLRTSNASHLVSGAPVLYRGIRVGHIEAIRLADGADGVLLDAFIESPDDKRLTTAARFWETSGISLTVGMGGVRLDMADLASIIAGGIAFDTNFAGGGPLSEDTTFTLFPDEDTARAAVGVAQNALHLTIRFDGSVQGLEVGTDVRFHGLRVGEVTAISSRIIEEGDETDVFTEVDIAIDPVAMGLPDGAGPADLEAFLTGEVEAGLRARLSTTGFLGRSFIVDLAIIPEAAPAILQKPDGELPIMPSVAPDLSSLNTSKGLIARLDKLPVEKLLDQAISLMAATEKLIRSEGAQELLPAFSAALGEVRSTLAELQDGNVVKNFNDTLSSAGSAATSIAEAAKTLPQLVDQLDRVLNEAERMVSAYGARSSFNEEILAALREARGAARSLSQLARAIERNPNSLLFGR